MSSPKTTQNKNNNNTTNNNTARQWASPRQLNFGGPPGPGAAGDAGAGAGAPDAPAVTGAPEAPVPSGARVVTLTTEQRERLAWGRVRALKIAPDRLPLSWTAYDSLRALVVQGGAAGEADP